MYNCDGTGLTTVLAPLKVISQHGVKQVAKVTSAKRRQLVIMLGFTNAIGNTIQLQYFFYWKSTVIYTLSKIYTDYKKMCIEMTF